MAPILQHLVEMTGHRDQLRLELSVLQTLLQLGTDMRVRALEFFFADAEVMVRPRSWSEDGEVITSHCDAASDPARQTLDELPELARCIEQKATSAVRADAPMHTLWLPVWVNDKAHACLEITQRKAFSRQQRDVILGVFRVYQNYQNLLDYSERDALTGLHNRKTFEEQFARYAAPTGDPARAKDAPPQQWLAILDIDHFKRVNDEYGHLYGDEVLILVANLLRNSFRAQDRIFRFGGEEFVVLLRSHTEAAAHEAFERFRARVKQTMFPQIGGISVSIGYCAAQQGAPVEVLGRADQALYYAKENGRNQVHCYDELMRQGLLKAQIAHSEVELF